METHDRPPSGTVCDLDHGATLTIGQNLPVVRLGMGHTHQKRKILYQSIAGAPAGPLPAQPQREVGSGARFCEARSPGGGRGSATRSRVQRRTLHLRASLKSTSCVLLSVLLHNENLHPVGSVSLELRADISEQDLVWWLRHTALGTACITCVSRLACVARSRTLLLLVVLRHRNES